MDFVVYKSEADNTGRLVELVHNKHCEVYEVIVDGIPVFNCTDYSTAEHEYNMECVQSQPTLSAIGRQRRAGKKGRGIFLTYPQPAGVSE